MNKRQVAGQPQVKRQRVMEKEEEENQRTEFLMDLLKKTKASPHKSDNPCSTPPVKVYEPKKPTPVKIYEPKPQLTCYEPAPVTVYEPAVVEQEEEPAEEEKQGKKKRGQGKKRESKAKGKGRGKKGATENPEIPEVPDTGAEQAGGEAQPEEQAEEKEQSEEVTSEADHENPLESFESFCDALDTWKEPMGEIIDGPQFQELYDFVSEEYNTTRCYPPRYQIFNAYQLTPMKDVKVVIIGQDPYIQPNQAMGLCFSINPKKRYVPKTLIELYRNLERNDEIDFKFPDPLHGDLTCWAQQGVFLLNSCLTTRKYKRGSHKWKGWENFTKETIKMIDRHCKGVVYLLFGNVAQKTAKPLVNSDYNLILCEKLPSFVVGQQFKNSKCFSECNNYLTENGKTPIDWNLEQLEKPEAE